MNILALFSEKMKNGVEGRKKSPEILFQLPEYPIIWMHAASLGEYLQGLPVLQALENEYPEDQILLSFFSPSGYEAALGKVPSHYKIIYLPYDEIITWKRLLTGINIRMFVLVKYDYWYHLLAFLKKKNVPVYVISVLFYEQQLFFRYYGKWFRHQLQKNVTWFFHQTRHSLKLAISLGIKNGSWSGDTRIDQVKTLLTVPFQNELLDSFCAGNKVIVFGSSWETEEQLAKILFDKTKKVRFILAPHDISRLEYLVKVFPEALCLSETTTEQIIKSRIVLVDSIGQLSRIYRYADIAVVGGGFHSKGLHNILEAAVYGKPVIFGNKYRKNPEADALILSGGAASFSDEYEAGKFCIRLLQQPIEMEEMGKCSLEFIKSQPHATSHIVKQITSSIM